MKKFICIVFCLFFPLSVCAQIITGGVELSVQDARQEVLSSNRAFINPQNIKNNFIDPNYKENKSMLLKGITELKDRKLGKFSDGSYAIMYYSDVKNTYYYSPEGILTHNEVKSEINYPFKSYRYTPAGDLVNMSLKVSEDETFIFTPNGKLIAHWIGQNCYDENNNIIMTRKRYF